MFERRAFLETSAATAIIPARLLAENVPILHPEDFGAKGDGVSNDTQAFADLSAEVNRIGGGTIILRRQRTYVVGEQRPGGDYGWTPTPVLELKKLSRPLRVIGNGARLRCTPGLRYGTFDLQTGQPMHRPLPNYIVAEVATPYRAMIHIAACNGPVEVCDLELDGGVETLRIGGPFGDSGWQIPATGLFLEENTDSETIENLHSHHHGQDGAMIIGAAARAGRSRVRRLVCHTNGRQGLSVVAGQAYDFEDCEMAHTGRSAIRSAPGAGLDIEAERRPIRDLTFTRCSFVDNAGVGMVADSGDSEGVRFVDCLFVGTTTWSAWPNKPRFSFQRCTFVGAVVHPFPDADAARAAHFIACNFTDDPRRSPRGAVYLGNGPIVNLAVSDNVLFDGCNFTLVADGLLPWSWRAIYHDCRMSQRSPRKSTPKGRYLGHSTISGNVDLYGAMVDGELIINGRLIPRGSQGGPPW